MIDHFLWHIMYVYFECVADFYKHIWVNIKQTCISSWINYVWFYEQIHLCKLNRSNWKHNGALKIHIVISIVCSCLHNLDRFNGLFAPCTTPCAFTRTNIICFSMLFLKIIELFICCYYINIYYNHLCCA